MTDRSQLVLSIFPGIDLLGRGFEAAGFCVVRGPDPIFGGDIRNFHPPNDAFAGVIGGPPCQDFSAARRKPPTGHGLAMLAEFARVVATAHPLWWLLENVPRCPTLEINGYTVQRLDCNARDAGQSQHRLRHFQFGSRTETIITPRQIRPPGQSHPICLASEPRRPGRRSFAEFCELQGLSRTFDLPAFTLSAKFAAVGNGVPIPLATQIAEAIAHQRPAWMNSDLCACGCGRQITGKEKAARPACRKRLQRRRETASNRTAALAGVPPQSQSLRPAGRVPPPMARTSRPALSAPGTSHPQPKSRAVHIAENSAATSQG